MRPFSGDDAAWDAAVAAMPAPHLLQSAAWGALKRRWGWEAERFVWPAGSAAGSGLSAPQQPLGPDLRAPRAAPTDPRPPAALAQVLLRRIGRLPWQIAYVAKGPLLAGDEAEAWRVPLQDLGRWARSRRILYVKMDPDFPRERHDVAALWRSLGWRPSSEQIQFPHTLRSRLADDATLLAGMQAKTRYNIGLAQRRGVTVREAGPAGLPAFLRLYEATGRRAGFGLRAPAYYEDLIADFLARGMATLLLAEREGQALAAAVPVAYGGRAWYLYGASADLGREHMPAQLLQWACLRWARDRGCTVYDWWGGPDPDDPADPLWGIGRFKMGFGAGPAAQMGAWDLVLRPLAFGLFRRLRDRRLRRVPAAVLR